MGCESQHQQQHSYPQAGRRHSHLQAEQQLLMLGPLKLGRECCLSALNLLWIQLFENPTPSSAGGLMFLMLLSTRP